MNSLTIPKKIDTGDARDFDFLRQKGLDHIKALSRKIWTDYNTHDPGITFLEVLCYAITDLGNRINLPIRDLLTESNGNGKTIVGPFPTAKQILTTGPVSERDYQKLFIDIDGVNNAFIEVNDDIKVYRHCSKKDEATDESPRGKLSYDEKYRPEHYDKIDTFTYEGLYNIRFEPDYNIQLLQSSGEQEEREEKIEEIKGKIKKRYHANRNLCEDLVKVEETKYFDVRVCGDIELVRTANPSDVMAEIFFRVQKHLSPSVKFYSLQELLEQGRDITDIFEGAVLKNGFIPDEELKKTAVKKEIHLSDLVQIVMETPGVSGIQKLKLGKCGTKDEETIVNTNNEAHDWKLCLDNKNLLPRLCTEKSITGTNLFKDVIPVSVETGEVIDKIEERILQYQQEMSPGYDDILIEKGTDVQTGAYSTIQNDLPQLYGTDEYGLSPSLPKERHAKALQLKSYLLFFDKILATYFGHLEHVGDLFSSNIGDQSYFNTPIQGVEDEEEGFKQLVRDYAGYENDVEQVLQGLDHYNERKNAFLDHLLARFAENMNEYIFAMLDNFGEDLTNETLWHKATLLKEYPEISYNRATGFNYYNQPGEVWNTNNVAGLKHRLARLLGIRDYSRRDLTIHEYDIYQERDDDTTSEWRWRILQEDGTIMLSSSKHYHSKSNAEDEMWISFYLGKDRANYDLLKTEDGEEYYFNLVDKTGEVVARHIQYYPTRAEAKNDIIAFSSYLNNRLSAEGMFLFENILFRPDEDDPDANKKFLKICMDRHCKQCKPVDPYSLRLTIVFPGWTKRFSNLYFREYAEKVIRREVPAHILCRICWIGNTIETEQGGEITAGSPMGKLEDLYKKWLTVEMKNPGQPNKHLKPLVDLLHDLETVYPPGQLYDCSTAAQDDTKNPYILDRTRI